MEILLQLGANKTVFIQFILFIVSISFLTMFVYAPFFKAYDQRQRQTMGAEQVANEAQDEAKKIESIYKMRAREINEKIKNIFDLAKTQATDSGSAVLNQAKTNSGADTEKARQEIAAQRVGAEKSIQAVAQDVASELTKKLMGSL